MNDEPTGKKIAVFFLSSFVSIELCCSKRKAFPSIRFWFLFLRLYFLFIFRRIPRSIKSLLHESKTHKKPPLFDRSCFIYSRVIFAWFNDICYFENNVHRDWCFRLNWCSLSFAKHPSSSRVCTTNGSRKNALKNRCSIWKFIKPIVTVKHVTMPMGLGNPSHLLEKVRLIDCITARYSRGSPKKKKSIVSLSQLLVLLNYHLNIGIITIFFIHFQL